MSGVSARDPLTDAQRDEAERHLKFCGYAANRFAAKYRHISRDAFYSAAFDGLADAVRGFDEDRGVALECYAPKRIEGACLDLLRRERGGVVRVSRGADDEHLRRVVSLDSNLHDSGSNSRPMSLGDSGLPSSDPPPDFALAARDEFERLLVGLSAVERFVVRKLYGHDGWNLRQIAAHLGISPSRASQVRIAALARIGARAARLGLGCGRVPLVAPHRRRSPHKRERSRLSPSEIDPTRARVVLAACVGADPATLGDLLGRLKPRQRQAVELRHGLDGQARPWGEVARLMGRTRPGAEYAHKMGLARLREMAGMNVDESRRRNIAS